MSTDKDGQADSLDSQVRFFTEYIERNPDMEIAEVYHDDGISGTNVEKRDAFNKMIDDAEKGKIDFIITKEVSRFARNTVDTLEYVRRLKKRGIGVFFMTDNINTSENEGEFRLTIMASISQEESRKTSERVKWGQTRRMEQGVVFGRDLLGYTVKSGKLYINKYEAEIVKLIFHKYINEGKGTHVIAKELYEAGFHPKRVKKWSNTAVLRVLSNEKYVGDLCQKKTYTPDFLTHKKKYNKDKNSMIYLKDHHEPIIDRETWDRTQEELKRRSISEEQKKKYSNKYWCSGKLICGECGSSFVSRTKKLIRGGKYRAWRCIEAARYGQLKTDLSGNKIGCNCGSVNEKVIVSAVSYCISSILSIDNSIKNDMLCEIEKVINSSVNIDTSDLYKQIDVLENKKKKVIDLCTEGLISETDLKFQNTHYDEKISVIKNQIKALENIEKENQYSISSIEDYISEIDRMMNFGPEDTEIYRLMLKKIVIHKNNILNIYLGTLPFPIILKYHTSGKLDKFKAEFEFSEQ